MSVPVTITTAQVPASFCPSNIQTDWPFLVALLSASMAGEMTSFVISETVPDVDDQDKPWLKLNADGTPDRVYLYANGNWLAKHPIAANNDGGLGFPGLMLLYEGSSADIATLDGGEAGTVTKTSGPFWEIATELAAKFPIGVGTLPVSGTVIGEGDTGGADEQEITLTEDNLPSHSHQIGVESGGTLEDTLPGRLITNGGDEVIYSSGSTTRVGPTRDTGGGEAITLDKMPPYYGLYFIRRTARQYYRGA